ncbi:MAG TPA: SCO family protein [Pyrinomonadaceae bacterium]|nr:SCO family protein [Pyrinomonadaceae bacterium]
MISVSRIGLVLTLCCLWLGGQVPPAIAQTNVQQQSQQALAAKGEGSGKLSIPDAVLLDQDGRRVRFYTDLIKGKVVIINFVFTSCTIVCPPLGANFARIQTALGERLGKDVHLISITRDPEMDTPAKLRTWGAKFGARPGWTLVTGEKAQIDEVLLALIGDIARKGEHSAIVLVGSDARGVWKHDYGLAAPARLLKLADDLNR